MKSYHDIISDGGSNVVGQVEEQRFRLQSRLQTVKNVVAIMSGKGGVGKSTIAVNLAEALLQQGHRVGLLDADINGASIAKMAGVRGFEPSHSADGVTCAVSVTGLRVMSTDLFLPGDSSPVVWEAPTQEGGYLWRPMVEMGVLRELIADTAWGDLDFLLVDLPPGGNALANLAHLVSKLAGALVVTVGSGVSQLIVGRSIALAEEVAEAKVLGLVENMGPHQCEACGHIEALFGDEESVSDLAHAHGIPFFGSIPFAPSIRICGDRGISFVEHARGSPAACAFATLADRVVARLLYTEHVVL